MFRFSVYPLKLHFHNRRVETHQAAYWRRAIPNSNLDKRGISQEAFFMFMKSPTPPKKIICAKYTVGSNRSEDFLSTRNIFFLQCTEPWWESMRTFLSWSAWEIRNRNRNKGFSLLWCNGDVKSLIWSTDLTFKLSTQLFFHMGFSPIISK